MPDPIAGVQVVIEEPDNSVRVDDVTGTIETDQADGGVVVQLDAHRPKKDGVEGEDPFYRNLADEMSASQIGLLENELHEQISADDASRTNYLAVLARGLDLVGFELKEPRANVGDQSAAVEGMATVTNPLLAEAMLKGWANAQAELLPSSGPVKVSVKGDEDAQDDSLAEAFERDLNYWFTETATEYYPDTSHMLLWGPHFGGTGFKKIYRCPMKLRPTSESVKAEDLIVSDAMKDLRSCARITHQIKMRPSVMKRMKHIGAYRNIPAVQQPSPTVNEVEAKISEMQGTSPTPQRPEDQPYTLWESQCELDIPQFAEGTYKGTGIPLPYLVTMDKDSREILAIRRDWEEDDSDCGRLRMYVRYPYVPGPGFYGTGLLHILGNASAAMTAAWRLALDAGMFANFPAGLIAKLGGRQNTSDFRLSPGIFQPIETNGMPMANVVTGLPYKDITPGLLALIDKITTQSQSLGTSAEIPTAEGVQNVPVGTMLAQIEQATKIMAAAFKGMHYAQAEEITLIVKLFRKNPEDFWKSNKNCPKDFWTVEKFEQALNDCNLAPASDPNTPSHIHRVAKALGVVSLTTNPMLAPTLSAVEVTKYALEVMKVDRPQLLAPPAPAAAAPDANTIAAGAKMLTAQTQAAKVQAQAQNDQQENAIKQAELGTEKDIATVNLAKEMIIHKNDNALAQRDQGLDIAKHGLDVAKATHDASLDVAQHGLDVHQALNPPVPATPKATP